MAHHESNIRIRLPEREALRLLGKAKPKRKARRTAK